MHRSVALLLALSLLFCAQAPLHAFGQESAILRAIESGQIEGKSELALPADAAPAPPSMAAETLLRITREQESDITNRAYPLMTAKWPFNEVFVCWEQEATEYFEERQLVRAAILETWQANSGLRFIGWGTCNPGARGIRILIEDSGPHVKALGKYLDGITNGMVLNFTYLNWGSSCQSRLDYCNRAIAVHEFGHAIGFAHEQNRPDTPGECTDPPQGSSGDTLLTPWDPHSVMNYCNERYANDGVLSPFDVAAVQYIYGLP